MIAAILNHNVYVKRRLREILNNYPTPSLCSPQNCSINICVLHYIEITFQYPSVHLCALICNDVVPLHNILTRYLYVGLEDARDIIL